MDTIAAVFGALASGLRWLFDLGLMAVGVPPSGVPIADSAVAPMEPTHEPGWAMPKQSAFDEMELSKTFRESLDRWDVDIITFNK